MAHDFRFGEAGQTDGALAALSTEARIGNLRLRNIHARHAGAAEFEDQPFLMIEAPVAGDRGQRIALRGARCCGTALIVHHHRTPASASASAVQSSSDVVSVAATMRRFAAPGSFGIRREAGTPAMMFSSSTSRLTTCAAGFGKRIVNSLKKDGVTS